MTSDLIMEASGVNLLMLLQYRADVCLRHLSGALETKASCSLL